MQHRYGEETGLGEKALEKRYAFARATAAREDARQRQFTPPDRGDVVGSCLIVKVASGGRDRLLVPPRGIFSPDSREQFGVLHQPDAMATGRTTRCAVNPGLAPLFPTVALEPV